MVVQGQGTTCYGWSNMFGEQRSRRVRAVHPLMGGFSLIELAHSSEGKAGEGPQWPSAEWPSSKGPCFPPGKSTVSIPCAVTQPASSAPGPRKALRGESNTSRERQVIRQSCYWGITHCDAAMGLGRLESIRSLVTRF